MLTPASRKQLTPEEETELVHRKAEQTWGRQLDRGIITGLVHSGVGFAAVGGTRRTRW